MATDWRIAAALALALAACDRTAAPEPAAAPAAPDSVAPPPAAGEADAAIPSPDAGPDEAAGGVAIDEPLPPFDEIGAVPEVVAQGAFSGTAGRPASGAFRIFQIPDDRLLRIEGLQVVEAPGLDVVLLEAAGSLQGAVVLAALKGSSGNQNYLMDVRLNLRKYAAVGIADRTAGVIYAQAPLR